MSSRWMRPTQRNEKELSERTALFLRAAKGVHYFPRTARRDMPPARGRAALALQDDFTISYYPLLRSRWRLCCLTDAAHPLRVPLC